MTSRFICLFFFLIYSANVELTLADQKNSPALPTPPSVDDEEFIKPEVISKPDLPQTELKALPLPNNKVHLPDVTDVIDPDIAEISVTPQAISPVYSFPIPSVAAFIGNTFAHRYLPKRDIAKGDADSSVIPLGALKDMKPISSHDVTIPEPPTLPAEATVSTPNEKKGIEVSLPSFPPAKEDNNKKFQSKLQKSLNTVPVKITPPLETAPDVKEIEVPDVPSTEEENLNTLAPLPVQNTKDQNSEDWKIKDSAISKDEPFSVYYQDEKRDSVILREKNQRIKNIQRNSDLTDLVDSIDDTEDEESNILLSLGQLLPETEEEALLRLEKELLAKRNIEIASVHKRAHLNYKTESLPAVIYNNDYSAANLHLPKPRYISQYREYAFQTIDNNDISALRTFLNMHSFAEKRDAEGNTPLIYATEKNRPDIVRLLLARHANVHALNNMKATALHMAAYTGASKIATLLLDAQARVNAQDSLGYTPLMLAAMYQQNDIVTLLLKHGANKALMDSKGRTASDIASATGDMALAEQLRHPVMLTGTGPTPSYYKKVTTKEISSPKKAVTKKPAKKSTKKKSSTKKPVKNKAVSSL